MNQPLAYVHPGAKIAKNVVIEPFATINNNVIIGEGTWVGSNVIIMEGARIGKNCSIFPGSVISAIPQDLKFNGEESLVVINDNTTIRECVTINRGTSDRGETIIGKNCLIMAYCHVAHDCIIGDNCIFSNNSTLGSLLINRWKSFNRWWTKEDPDKKKWIMWDLALIEAIANPKLAISETFFTPDDNVKREIKIYTLINVIEMKKKFWSNIKRYN